jgi:hypothetical protein
VAEVLPPVVPLLEAQRQRRRKRRPKKRAGVLAVLIWCMMR